ncbi:hypothetical protein LCGC14_0996840, partial [marine sediment metagenome]
PTDAEPDQVEGETTVVTDPPPLSGIEVPGRDEAQDCQEAPQGIPNED